MAGTVGDYRVRTLILYHHRALLGLARCFARTLGAINRAQDMVYNGETFSR
ncbi:MAG: hypothetical protein ABI406_07075 [Ktedonobacteraceae bacterium]